MPTQRKLAATLFTDIVGSTAVTARSESAGLDLRDRHRGLVRPFVEGHHGRLVEAPGDETLSIFDSAVDATHCALAIQAAASADDELRLHIGVHLGEIVLRDHEVFGDGINVAARICALSDGSAPYVSDEVAQAIRSQENFKTTLLGSRDLKNVGRPVTVHALGAEAAAATGRAPPRGVGRGIALGVGGAALVAVAVAAYLMFGGRAPTDAGAPLTSIAVLPFDDMSPGGDQKWLADGMAEELIETLSRIDALRVLARTSAFALRGKDIATVAKELRVGSVVEGSVRRSDDQLRVTAQLIRVSDGSHLWSARYDRKLSDVFATQSDIARAIAEAIRGELGIEYESWDRSHEPSDVRAYELVKKGWNAMWPDVANAEGVRKAIESYEQAVAIDPEYARAYAELGWAFYLRWDYHGRAKNDLALARAHAERALARDATYGGAYNLLGFILWRQREWAEARRVWERGLAYNPGHGPLRQGFAMQLATQGRLAEALVELRRAADIDPAFSLGHWNLGFVHLLAKEYDDAVRELERARELARRLPNLPHWLAYAYHRNGMDDEALEAVVRDLPPELAGLEAAMRQGFRRAASRERCGARSSGASRTRVSLAAMKPTSSPIGLRFSARRTRCFVASRRRSTEAMWRS